MYKMLLAAMLLAQAGGQGEAPAANAPADAADELGPDGEREMGPPPSEDVEVSFPEGEPNIHALALTLEAVITGSPATKKAKATLTAQFMAMTKYSTPSEAHVTQLVADLAGALPGGKISSEKGEALAASLPPIVDPGGLSAKELEAQFKTVKANLEALGIGSDKVRTLMTDLRAVAKNAKKKG